jgi:hypothetical protein
MESINSDVTKLYLNPQFDSQSSQLSNGNNNNQFVDYQMFTMQQIRQMQALQMSHYRMFQQQQQQQLELIQKTTSNNRNHPVTVGKITEIDDLDNGNDTDNDNQKFINQPMQSTQYTMLQTDDTNQLISDKNSNKSKQTTIRKSNLLKCTRPVFVNITPVMNEDSVSANNNNNNNLMNTTNNNDNSKNPPNSVTFSANVESHYLSGTNSTSKSNSETPITTNRPQLMKNNFQAENKPLIEEEKESTKKVNETTLNNTNTSNINNNKNKSIGTSFYFEESVNDNNRITKDASLQFPTPYHKDPLDDLNQVRSFNSYNVNDEMNSRHQMTQEEVFYNGNKVWKALTTPTNLEL